MQTHAELWERHKAVMPSWLGLYYAQPIELVRGEGRHVWDREGNRYLDFFGGILTTMTGYNLPELTEVITAQATQMLHTSTLYLIEPMVSLAERIAALLPIPDAKVFFTNSGTEANDAALMMATTYRRSRQVMAFRGSYHGRSHSALAVTGQTSWSATENSPFTVHFLQSPQSLREAYGIHGDSELIDATVADLRSQFTTSVRGGVAALIAEPIQGVGGFVPLPDGMLAALKKELDLHDVLLIADEVQTGWGRTGDHFWGFEAHGVVPDLVTFAKGLGNGLAIAGVAGRAELIDSIHAVSVSTFGGNPLASAGALANLEYLLANDLQSNARIRGGELRSRLDAAAAQHAAIAEVRGRGLMLGVELNRADGAPDPAAATAILESARRHGLLIGKGGLHGDALRIAPPLTVTGAEIGDGADRLDAAFADALG
ncbi:MAG TPA: aspartate aminotransferase family protein [Acidimicrobiia bacterium]